MSDYESFLEKQNDEIIDNLCKDDINFWKEVFEKESEEEPTVIIDEIYLIRLQSEIRIMRETLTKIYKADDIFCLSDAQYEARLALDKTIGL